MRSEHGLWSTTAERMLAGQRLIGNDTERVKVRSMIYPRISNSLLGSHVSDGSDGDAHGRSQSVDRRIIASRPAHGGD